MEIDELNEEKGRIIGDYRAAQKKFNEWDKKRRLDAQSKRDEEWRRMEVNPKQYKHQILSLFESKHLIRWRCVDPRHSALQHVLLSLRGLLSI